MTLEKSLLEETLNIKSLAKENEDLKTSRTKITDALNVAHESCADLQRSLEKTQMDVFNTGDMAFYWAKDQVLCIYLELDISSVDLFKNILDGKLVDVEADDDEMVPQPQVSQIPMMSPRL
ncbi:hypothetical protein RYX36_029783, partial [Vicia faba]